MITQRPSGWSLASFIAGILALASIPLAAICALVLGTAGLRDSRNDRIGRWMSWYGIAMALLMIVISFVRALSSGP